MHKRTKGTQKPPTKELDDNERELFLNAFYQSDFSLPEKYVQETAPAVSAKKQEKVDDDDAQLFLDAIAGISDSLVYAKERHEKPNTPSPKIAKKRSLLDAKIDLHGLHAEQAVTYLLRFLDQELQKNSRTLLIVHGKGQGILKKAVWSIIETHPMVDDFQVAPGKFGGHGAILVRIGRRGRR